MAAGPSLHLPNGEANETSTEPYMQLNDWIIMAHGLQVSRPRRTRARDDIATICTT